MLKQQSQTAHNLQMEGLHFDVIEATLKAIQTQSIMPIVKEELKLKIQASRLAAGKKELPKPVFKEPQKYKLTAEEEEQRKHKRERNRIAAEKCRKKKKGVVDSGFQELESLRNRNAELKLQVAELEGERSNVIGKLTAAGFNVSELFIKQEENIALPSCIPSASAQLPTTSTDYSDIAPPFCVQQYPQFAYTSQPTPSVQSTFSGSYTEMSPLPQALPPFRRASIDVINHVTQEAPLPYRRFSAEPYMSFPSTSSDWPDMSERLCEGKEEPKINEEACYKLFNDGGDFNGMDFMQMDQIVEDELHLFMKDEGEALVPGQHFEKIRESPSFY